MSIGITKARPAIRSFERPLPANEAANIGRQECPTFESPRHYHNREGIVTPTVVKVTIAKANCKTVRPLQELSRISQDAEKRLSRI